MIIMHSDEQFNSPVSQAIAKHFDYLETLSAEQSVQLVKSNFGMDESVTLSYPLQNSK